MLIRPATGPYHEPHESKPPYLTYLRSILTLPSHLYLVLPYGHFLSGLLDQTLYGFLISPEHAICPVLLILFDLITLTTICEGYNYEDPH